MKKNKSLRLFAFLLMLLLPMTFIGQQEKQVQLKWTGIETQQTIKNLSVKYMRFENSGNLYEFGALPVYSFTLPSPGEFLTYALSLSDIVADTITADEAVSLTDMELVSDKIQYRIHTNTDGVTLSILPFQRTEKENTYLRFKQFTVLIDLIPADSPDKKEFSAVHFTNESVLNSGTWFKLGIVETGVHKLTYSDLEDMGINPQEIDLDQLGIFGNYEGMLPESNSDPRPDDLQENSIFVAGADDGQFDTEDFILFYAKSAVHWRYNIFTGRFNHFNNLFSDTTYYFLTTNKGNNKRITTEESSGQTPSETIYSYYDYAAHESDLENLIYSGKQWYGERLTLDTSERTFSFHFPGLKTSRPVYLGLELAVRAYENTYYRVYVNDEIVVDSTRILKITANGSYARKSIKKITFFTNSENLDVKIKYYTTEGTSIAWINYIELNVEKELKFDDGQMGFRDPHTAAAGNVTDFNFSFAKSGATIWDVSDGQNPIHINYLSDNNGSIHFTVPTDTIRDFVIFDESSSLKPVTFEAIENQNLHGISEATLIVISPEIFLEQANRYAQIHREIDGMTVHVITPQQIYNEFSSGSQDISAIRDFMRMLWKKEAFGGNPGYLLLFGDGSFDYKHRILHNTNFVPTYQSDESLIFTKSYVSDDYFGLLDDGEGFNCSGILDIGIGRFPVSSKEQAEAVVNKLENYLAKNTEVMRNWRNDICFIADDQDGNLHLKQARQLISIVDTIPAWFITHKVFTDAYTKIQTTDGKRYPEVNEKIRKQVENGALIVNYTGHGGLVGWAEERILDVPTIRAWKNINNLPLFITATCEFSRFDDPEFISAGEHTFLNEKGGAIALMTTTRLAFAAANIIVNRRIYYHLVEKENGNYPRLGDLMRMSKNPSSAFYLNFTLLGDPALRLAYPQHNIITTNVNNKASGEIADTVHAMSLISIQGEIVDQSGSKLQDFNGYLYPKVYDKPTKYTTLGNDAGSYPTDFLLLDKILYAGKISVVNGSFEFTVQIPKDIAYQYGFGEISYYAIDTVHFEDAWGKYDQFLIGGMDEQAETDDQGPNIGLFLDDRTFVEGNTTRSNPLLIADLFDEQGIQTTGQSLGRDLSLVLDNNFSSSRILNEYFSPHIDTYQSGEIKYQLNKLSKGWHTISLKAWDLQNNSTEKSVDFYVDDNAEILLKEVVNFPNPFIDETNFGFIHNKSGAQLKVEIRIYDMSGRFVGDINETVNSSGYQINPIVWDGKNQNGERVKSGLYSYEIKVTDPYGNISVQRQKMIKLGE